MSGSVTTPPGPPPKTFAFDQVIPAPNAAVSVGGTDSHGNPWTCSLNVPLEPGSITGSLSWSIPSFPTSGTYLGTGWNNEISEVQPCNWTPTSTPAAGGGCTVSRIT